MRHNPLARPRSGSNPSPSPSGHQNSMSPADSKTDSLESQLITPSTDFLRRASWGNLSSTTVLPNRSTANMTPTPVGHVLLRPGSTLSDHAQRIPSQASLSRGNKININPATSRAARPHPHGTIGDRSPLYSQQPVSITAGRQTDAFPASRRTRATQIPKQSCDISAPHGQFLAPSRQPAMPPMASVLETVLSHMSSFPADKSGAPVYFKPMFSLMAPGAEYHPNQPGMGPTNQTSPPRMNITDPAVLRAIQGTSSGLDRLAAGFSPWYRGDISLRNNQSENITDDQNCSLFIVNLPSTLTTHELLGSIHSLGPSGRIYAVHINGPELHHGHPGCAAKVVFFKRNVAHEFYSKCASDGKGFAVNGQPARVMWNRIKTSERQHLSESNASRVLLIAGPPQIVNPRTLTEFFNTKLQFQVDRIITHVEGTTLGEDAVVEYRFGSFRCQAQAAKMALTRELPRIRCFFGMDPLEPRAWTPLEYYKFETRP